MFINFKITSKRDNIIIIKKSRMLKENNIYKFKLAITNFIWNLLKYEVTLESGRLLIFIFYGACLTSQR